MEITSDACRNRRNELIAIATVARMSAGHMSLADDLKIERPCSSRAGRGSRNDQLAIETVFVMARSDSPTSTTISGA